MSTVLFLVSTWLTQQPTTGQWVASTKTPTIPAPSIIYHFHGAEVLSTESEPLPSEMLYVGCYRTLDKCLTIAAVPSSSSYFVLIYHAVHLEGNFLSRIKWWDVLYNDEANVDTFTQISSDILIYELGKTHHPPSAEKSAVKKLGQLLVIDIRYSSFKVQEIHERIGWYICLL